MQFQLINFVVKIEVLENEGKISRIRGTKQGRKEILRAFVKKLKK